MQHQVKNIYQLENELINAKVEIAVEKAINRVLGEMSDFRKEMQQFRQETNDRLLVLHKDIGGLDKRLVAVETKLGMANEAKRDLRVRFLDYAFKAGWAVTAVIASYSYIHFVH